MSQYVVWIPVVGDPKGVRFNSDSHIPVRALLEEHGSGFYVHFDLEVEGESGGRLAYLATEDGPRNPRAEQAVVLLTGGTHMRITGNACLSDIPADKAKLIAETRLTTPPAPSSSTPA